MHRMVFEWLLIYSTEFFLKKWKSGKTKLKKTHINNKEAWTFLQVFFGYYDNALQTFI